MAPDRWQAISWNNDNIIIQYPMVSLGHNELTIMVPRVEYECLCPDLTLFNFIGPSMDK